MKKEYQNFYQEIKIKQQTNKIINENEAGFMNIFENFLKEQNPLYLNLLDILFAKNKVGKL